MFFLKLWLNLFTGCEYISALSVDGSKVSVKSRTKSPSLSLLSGPGPVSQKSGSVRLGPGEKTGPWLRLAVSSTGEKTRARWRVEIQVTIQVDTLGRYRHGRDSVNREQSQ